MRKWCGETCVSTLRRHRPTLVIMRRQIFLERILLAPIGAARSHFGAEAGGGLSVQTTRSSLQRSFSPQRIGVERNSRRLVQPLSKAKHAISASVGLTDAAFDHGLKKSGAAVALTEAEFCVRSIRTCRWMTMGSLRSIMNMLLIIHDTLHGPLSASASPMYKHNRLAVNTCLNRARVCAASTGSRR